MHVAAVEIMRVVPSSDPSEVTRPIITLQTPTFADRQSAWEAAKAFAARANGRRNDPTPYYHPMSLEV